jgi:hypothetical protein
MVAETQKFSKTEGSERGCPNEVFAQYLVVR